MGIKTVGPATLMKQELEEQRRRYLHMLNEVHGDARRMMECLARERAYREGRTPLNAGRVMSFGPTLLIAQEIQREEERLAKEGPALTRQEGGSHYKDMRIQPVEYIHANNIPFIEGNVIKYVSRWRNKNGIQDLKKAMHFLQLLIDLEGQK